MRKLLERLVGDNPYSKRGVSPVGPSEGLIMSDIRFHHALVLRSKNAHVFRPDLFSTAVQATNENLGELAECRAMIKLRYVSEEPLKDRRHLQFLTHAADATAALTNSNLIFDSIGERLYTKQEFEDLLRAEPQATSADQHLRVVWFPNLNDGHAATLGLRKIGVRELITAPVSGDERWIATEVLGQAAVKLWENPEVLDDLSAEVYSDTFQVVPTDVNDDQVTVRILRVQAT
jgi:hypothetical protein